MATASDLCENVTIAIKKLKPCPIPLSEIPKNENGHYGRESTYIEIEQFNKQLRNNALEMTETLKWTKKEVLRRKIPKWEISTDGVFLNLAGEQKLFKIFPNNYQQHNNTVSQQNIARRQFQRF